MLTTVQASAFIAFYGALAIRRSNQHRPEVYHFVLEPNGTIVQLVAVAPTGFEMAFSFPEVEAVYREECEAFTAATGIAVIKCNRVITVGSQSSIEALVMLDSVQKELAQIAAETHLATGKPEQGHYFDQHGRNKIDRTAQNGFGGKYVSWIGGWKSAGTLAEMVPMYNEKGLRVGMVHPKSWEYSGAPHFSALGNEAYATQVAVAAIGDETQRKALQDAIDSQLHARHRAAKDVLYFGPVAEAILKGCDGDRGKMNSLLFTHGH